MENTFESMGISPALVEGLKKQEILQPMPVQLSVIPAMLSGQDILARSETGSGKTIAYLLPLFEKIDINVRSAQAIILTPTHELASQVYQQAVLLAENAQMPIKSVLLIGGAAVGRQLDKLKEKPQIIVGSSGRILDLIQKRKINAQTVKTIVVDEADRLLDSRNIDGVCAVIKTTLKDRQLVLLSASITEQTKKTAQEMLKADFLDIAPENKIVLPENISHYYIVTDRREKFVVLRKLLAGEEPKKAIVFINNPENIRVIVDKLNYHGIRAAGIYGGARKLERQNAMQDFRTDRAKVLVASDIGARGLDIPGVTHVIHFDIPEEPVFYLHRTGRTGRAGLSGKAISITTLHECKWIRKYEKTWNIHFLQMEMQRGKMVPCAQVKKPAKTPKSREQKWKKENVTKK